MAAAGLGGGGHTGLAEGEEKEEEACPGEPALVGLRVAEEGEMRQGDPEGSLRSGCGSILPASAYPWFPSL